MRPDTFGMNQADDAEQTQQTRCRSPHRLGDVLPRCLKAQVNLHLFKGRLHWPAGREPTDHLRAREQRVGRVEVLISMGTLNVANEDPGNRHHRGPDLYHKPVPLAQRTLRFPPPHHWAVTGVST
jgi:hypothetical protein